jgi:hypothetical protein
VLPASVIGTSLALLAIAQAATSEPKADSSASGVLLVISVAALFGVAMYFWLRDSPDDADPDDAPPPEPDDAPSESSDEA